MPPTAAAIARRDLLPGRKGVTRWTSCPAWSARSHTGCPAWRGYSDSIENHASVCAVPLAGGPALCHRHLRQVPHAIQLVTRSQIREAGNVAREDLHEPVQITVGLRLLPRYRLEPVGADNDVTLCDLRILVEEAAKPIASPDADVVLGRRDVSPAVGWLLAEGPVRPVGVVVISPGFSPGFDLIGAAAMKSAPDLGR
jgi:hypothetical protein